MRSRSGFKTPFEFVVSARARRTRRFRTRVCSCGRPAELGEPLYQCQPPTGYKDTADAWVNTGALVGRMNFGLALAANKLRGVVVSNALPDGVVAVAAFLDRRRLGLDARDDRQGGRRAADAALLSARRNSSDGDDDCCRDVCF